MIWFFGFAVQLIIVSIIGSKIGNDKGRNGFVYGFVPGLFGFGIFGILFLLFLPSLKKQNCCVKCGNTYKDNANYCPICGIKIENILTLDKKHTEEPDILLDNNWICSNCGNNNEMYMIKCNKCNKYLKLK